MNNELGILTTTGLHNPNLLFWSCVLNEKIIFPLRRNDYEAWVKIQCDYCNVNETALYSWILPIDDFDYEYPELINRKLFNEAYSKLNSNFTVYTSKSNAYDELSRTLYLATKNSITINLVPEEYNLISDLTELPHVDTMCSYADAVSKLIFPNISDVTFDKILKVRKSVFLGNFHEFINGRVAQNEPFDTEIIKKFIHKELVDCLFSVKPTCINSTAIGILGNIPMVINPVSIASSFLTIKDQYKLKKDYGWLFFISESAQQ